MGKEIGAPHYPLGNIRDNYNCQMSKLDKSIKKNNIIMNPNEKNYERSIRTSIGSHSKEVHPMCKFHYT
ncbi:hypothetical protein BpHYR1_014903 [Brachionus plicatilis]|uniref:Uncharacterized protein n=1 Tax=Brachionus plicatilis TaxID=10195 RepID=A0A3M7R9J7_BRAPC|nr:hypothetical protein BpHYR1_014903 [Brachionus plicatilis]